MTTVLGVPFKLSFVPCLLPLLLMLVTHGEDRTPPIVSTPIGVVFTTRDRTQTCTLSTPFLYTWPRCRYYLLLTFLEHTHLLVRWPLSTQMSGHSQLTIGLDLFSWKIL